MVKLSFIQLNLTYAYMRTLGAKKTRPSEISQTDEAKKFSKMEEIRKYSEEWSKKPNKCIFVSSQILFLTLLLRIKQLKLPALFFLSWLTYFAPICFGLMRSLL